MGKWHRANMEPMDKPICNPYFSPCSTHIELKDGTEMGLAYVSQLGAHLRPSVILQENPHGQLTWGYYGTCGQSHIGPIFQLIYHQHGPHIQMLAGSFLVK